MKLVKSLAATLLLWVAMAILLCLIVLLPRDNVSHRVGWNDVMTYHFTWAHYDKNIHDYILDVIKTKTLGTTNFEVPVEQELWHYGKRSLLIFIPALLISIFAGIYKGLFDYQFKGKFWWPIGKGSTWLAQSIPDFFLIIIVQAVVSHLTYGYPNLHMYGNDDWYSPVLPALLLSMYPISTIARMTTQALEEEADQEYIRTARAKGIPEKVLLRRHILRNCWPKLAQHFMPIVLSLVTGMFIVEYFTLYRGIATRLIMALQIKTTYQPGQSMPIEIPVVIGFSLAFMLVFLLAQWIGQILTYYANPVRRNNSL
jgi:ABC-type dipeptide/oligopeptide/nickel transport system permease component